MVSGFIAGDKKVIETLYEKLFPSMRSWVIRNSGNESDAEDLFQEAMMAAFRKLQNPEYELQHELTTFIFAISKNMWLQRLRKGKVKAKYELSVSSEEKVDDLEEVIHEYEVQALYRQYFNKLDSECKRLLTYVFEGKAMSEIKELFKFKSESHTRKRKFRCKQKLTEMIHSDERFKELKEH